MSAPDTTRECGHCKNVTAAGQRCSYCGWPDPKAQPKMYLAYLKAAVRRAEAAAKKAGVDIRKVTGSRK